MKNLCRFENCDVDLLWKYLCMCTRAIYVVSL